jgi:hypothetical protein
MMARYAKNFPDAMAGVLRLSPGPNLIWTWTDAAREEFGGVVSQFGESAVFSNWMDSFMVLQAIEEVISAPPGNEVQVELCLVMGASVQNCAVVLCASERDLVGFRVV